MTIKARSQLDCALYCVADHLCQTVTFNQGLGLCQGHSTLETGNATSAVAQGDIVYQVETLCEFYILQNIDYEFCISM